ncbi:MAG: RNHCP domain-containing protein [Patescibacteria group bacterium]|uniref:RNHCP domain-containing protein n=1 Tax=candidate division WWE3 bacterium TaxID=2053526 RepID=A0A955ECI8_UNCKA|nr:RNHCP domain-containing protein [candidate division WWE3 bacterium]
MNTQNLNGFRCVNCGASISYEAPGTKNRNHCPKCLYSKHVDSYIPGDRNSDCKGNMAPIKICFKEDGEQLVVHKCNNCGFIRWNRIAGDDDENVLETLPIVDYKSLKDKQP